MLPLTFVSPEVGCIVLITEKVVKELMLHSQKGHQSHEAGGILIGEMRGKHFLVNRVSAPQKTDLRSRFGFVRNTSGHVQAVKKAVYETKGVSNYLGEWHTHPEDNPKPSQTDIESWIKNASSVRKNTLALIQGRKKTFVAFISLRGEITKLRQLENTDLEVTAEK